MSDKKNNLVNYCVYCGANISKENVYCPNCGRLVIEIKPKQDVTIKKSKPHDMTSPETSGTSRKCSGCGSIITSTVLVQCPICNTLLEALPERSINDTSILFIDKKLEPIRKIEKDVWDKKEGLDVFIKSILIYFIAFTFLIMLYSYQFYETNSYQSSSEILIILIITFQIPGIILGIYPIYYIVSRKHSFEKLGFPIKDKKILLALFIGILGGFGLIAIDFLSNYLNVYLSELGLNLYDFQEESDMQIRAIKRMGFWIFILLAELIFAAISGEIVFRGVLHNTLREKFGKEDKNGRILTILLVASIYSIIYLMFYFPIGLFFIIPNFLFFIFLGILYEINGNIYNTIIANSFYNVLLIFLIIFYF